MSSSCIGNTQRLLSQTDGQNGRKERIGFGVGLHGEKEGTCSFKDGMQVSILDFVLLLLLLAREREGGGDMTCHISAVKGMLQGKLETSVRRHFR